MRRQKERAPCAQALSVREAWSAIAEGIAVRWCHACKRFRSATCKALSALRSEAAKDSARRRGWPPRKRGER